MKKATHLILSAVAFFLMHNLYAQDTSKIVLQKTYSAANKGKLYIYWGWNRGYFSKSDIHFYGEEYDFTLSNVVAKDRQTPFGLDPYLNPMRISIPQTNLRIGYFINDHYNISIADDHMKYVMVQDQQVKINGSIHQASGSIYNGAYTDTSIYLTDDFLTFEHTNGLNYLNVALSRFDEVYRYKKAISINLTEGLGIGALVPRTDTKLLNYAEYDEFHLAGYGIDAKIGLNITFWQYFFLQSELKTGFINMPDIKTTAFDTDGAKQHFWFLQSNFVFGFSVPLLKN